MGYASQKRIAFLIESLDTSTVRRYVSKNTASSRSIEQLRAFTAQQGHTERRLAIKVTPNGNMTGKVWLQSQAKFSNIKLNSYFLKWLAGSTTTPTAPRIKLFRSILSGTKIIPCEIFLNIVTRQELVQNFQDQIANTLVSTISESGPIPEFQIEFFRVRGQAVTTLYRMLASSASNAETLNAKMARIMPGPSKDIIYIDYEVWSLLPTPTKSAYYKMQRDFADNHSALRLKGVCNPQSIIGRLNAAGTQIQHGNGKEVSIYTWLTMLVAADGFTLFPKVLTCTNGEIELWHNVAHTQEAKAWATTALPEIARLSKVDLQKDT